MTIKRLPRQLSGADVKSLSATKTADVDSTERSTLFVNSVDKAMPVLTAFDGSKRHLTLSQIAPLTDMDLSSAQRFTYTLATLGYLCKNPESKAYELSPKVFDFTTTT